MKEVNKPELMIQTKNKDAYAVQILTRNYLETKNEGVNIHLYGELINDIDAFTSEIESIQDMNVKFKSRNPQFVSPRTIKAFLELRDIDDESIESKYVSTVDVKYSRELLFKDILSLLTKTKYPENTSVQIIYVSSDTSNYKQLTMTENIECFNRYKNEFFKLNIEEQEIIVNALLNDSKSYHKLSPAEALMYVINRYKSGKLKIERDERFDTFINNFQKLSIIELTLYELIKTPMTERSWRRELGIFDVEDYK